MNINLLVRAKLRFHEEGDKLDTVDKWNTEVRKMEDKLAGKVPEQSSTKQRRKTSF